VAKKYRHVDVERRRPRKREQMDGNERTAKVPPTEKKIENGRHLDRHPTSCGKWGLGKEYRYGEVQRKKKG